MLVCGRLSGEIVDDFHATIRLFIDRFAPVSSICHGTRQDTRPRPSAAGAAGHFDPSDTNKHLGPYKSGHLGDLPVLVVNTDGTASTAVLAPRLKHLSEISNHALMIHVGGDNYSDEPEKLGGGGMRMVCGVITN